METISEEYRRLNAELHRSDKEYGINSASHYDYIMRFITSLATTSILDYGCGKGMLQKHLPFTIQQYDPAIPVHNRPPKPAKVVVCSDVLEHIEPDRLEAVLDHIQSLARDRVILLIALTPSRRILPDGRNTHLTLLPPIEWLQLLIGRWEPIYYEIDEKREGFIFVGIPHGWSTSTQ